jgi:hypothetical protein
MVALRTDSDSVVITVQDAGRGFDPSAMQGTVPGRHFGLPSVRDRITTMGGTLVIDSAVGKGTKIVMSVPLRQVSTSTSSTSLRAASAPVQDRVTNQPDGHPDAAILAAIVIAQVVSFVVSDEAGWITGDTIQAGGGVAM